MRGTVLERIVDGRTDLVFEYVATGHPANSTDEDGVSLIKWCAYYGDVSAIRFLLANGESLKSLGENLGLNEAAYHGHWRLLLDAGARIDAKDMSGDSPLSWASWHLRPDSILKRLCYGGFAIHPGRRSTFDHGMGWSALEGSLLGTPHV